MTILCKRCGDLQLTKGEKESNKQFDLIHHQLLDTILKHDSILYSWLNSRNFFSDLENLYFLHMPSETDWKKLVPYMYNEMFPISETNNTRFSKDIGQAIVNLKMT